MKYCYNCYNNFEDADNYHYCPFCGKPLYDEELVATDIYGVWEVFTEGKSLGKFEGDIDDILYKLSGNISKTFTVEKLDSIKVNTDDVNKDSSIKVSVRKILNLDSNYYALKKALEAKGLTLRKADNGYLEIKVGV